MVLLTKCTKTNYLFHFKIAQIAFRTYVYHQVHRKICSLIVLCFMLYKSQKKDNFELHGDPSDFEISG